ncbi:hypothetical protein CDL15_Pgr006307 [Punica granatum]|uniref:Uncharacterized protein n=1 Tax=Punica granatum TaxID=22663 RepID=A0A218W902_PUNGR|nr:hypothetical protein CDL15_Pgr006307 [Punica granatum]PKI51252.1 hypothetical protein CRG98_028347 [Punica granatum]
MQLLDDVRDSEFESDFKELHSTDKEIDDLYSARDIVINMMAKDEFFNMDDKKSDAMIEEAVKRGYVQDTEECEQILVDILSWDKLLPDDWKKEVEARLEELCEKGELQLEEAFEQFKTFEDEMLLKHADIMEEQEPPQFDEAALDKKKESDDPPGEGPILRWQTRVVFALAVTHGIPRIGRFEHREENRKDCLQKLLSLIEEAGKANKLEDACMSYVKDKAQS